MNGTELLAEYRARGSEDAFAQLVEKYTNLVYSVAKRRVGSESLAAEVAQMVFMRLAKALPQLKHEGELVAWLHRTAVHVSVDLWRSETRRKIREQALASMETTSSHIYSIFTRESERF